MITETSYILTDFESYCTVVIEMEKIKNQKRGYLPETILASLPYLRNKMEKTIASESDEELGQLKDEILNRHLKAFEDHLCRDEEF